jgi:hypothetical protein
MTSLGSRLRRDDAGSIVFGWLGRVALTLAVLGVAGFEVMSIAVTHVALDDVGRTAGDRALTTYAASRDPNQAYLAADQYVTENGAEMVRKSFEITPDAVSFEIKKTAPTLLLYRLDATAGYAEVKAVVYAEPMVESGSMP